MSTFVAPANSIEATTIKGGRQQFADSELDTWIRPSDWLAMPTVASTDNKFVGLFAVTNDDSNFVALTAAGNYTVDWGDGTVENFNSGVQANHQYTYSSISSSTNCSRGYRQVLITVTPQSGQTFTSINLDKKHSQSGLNTPLVKWLDIVLAGTSLGNNTRIGGAAQGLGFGNGNGNVWLSMLERLRILSSVIDNLYYSFTGLTACESIEFNSSEIILDASATFFGCSRLQKITFNVPSLSGSTGSMFIGCQSLKNAPWLNTSNVTYMAYMFSWCSALETVPLYDTSSVTDMNRMFENCHALKSVPQFNTINVTDMTNMFYSCYLLKEVPLFNTINVTSMSYMFAICISLKNIPTFNTSAVTNMEAFAYYCNNLTTFPLFNTSQVTSLISTFDFCNSLNSIPALDVSAVTDATNAFRYCSALSSSDITGLKTSVSYSSCNLSKNSIETIFTNLGKANGAQTITISSNWGAPAVVSLSGTTTSGSTTVTMASTSGLSTGMEISGTGISDAVAVTFQDTGDTVTRNAHGLSNGTPVSFASITSTTGISTYTRYYVVNATTNTFQVSDTVGGSAKALTTNGSGTLLYGTTISAITPNTSITLSVPASASGTVTTSSALLKRSIARLKGWTVSG